MPDLSEHARLFMAGYFALGPKSEIISHEPHATLAKRRAAYEECLAAGLVKEEPYNDHGSKRITSTEHGFAAAQEAFHAALEHLSAGGSHV